LQRRSRHKKVLEEFYRCTWLISDGAGAYKGLTTKFGLKHGSCNHVV
jgi:hypothetical protein